MWTPLTAYTAFTPPHISLTDSHRRHEEQNPTAVMSGHHQGRRQTLPPIQGGPPMMNGGGGVAPVGPPNMGGGPPMNQSSRGPFLRSNSVAPQFNSSMPAMNPMVDRRQSSMMMNMGGSNMALPVAAHSAPAVPLEDMFEGEEEEEYTGPRFGDHFDPNAFEEESSEKPVLYKIYFSIVVSVTLAVVFCFVMYYIFSATGDEKGFSSFKTNPMLGPSNAQLIELGAKYGIPIIEDGEVWRLFTSLFSHGGLIHLLFSLSLSFPALAGMEKVYGHLRTAAVFFLSGVGGMLLSAVMLPEMISCGPTPGISGIVMIMFMGLFQHWSEVVNPIRQMIQHLVTIAVFIFLGLFPGVDNFMHMGGALCGMLAGVAMLPNMRFNKPPRVMVTIACLLLAGYYIFFLALLYTTVDPAGWCSACVSMSCINVNDWCDTVATYNAQQSQQADKGKGDEGGGSTSTTTGSS